MRRASLGIVAAGLSATMACSSPTPWINDGLAVTLHSRAGTAGHAVSATLDNNTGANVQFGPPECGPIETEMAGQWQLIDSTAGRTCEAVIMSLSDGKSYPFTFNVPSNPGIYRLVTGAVGSDGKQLVLRSAAITVQ